MSDVFITFLISIFAIGFLSHKILYKEYHFFGQVYLKKTTTYKKFIPCAIYSIASFFILFKLIPVSSSYESIKYSLTFFTSTMFGIASVSYSLLNTKTLCVKSMEYHTQNFISQLLIIVALLLVSKLYYTDGSFYNMRIEQGHQLYWDFSKMKVSERPFMFIFILLFISNIQASALTLVRRAGIGKFGFFSRGEDRSTPLLFTTFKIFTLIWVGYIFLAGYSVLPFFTFLIERWQGSLPMLEVLSLWIKVFLLFYVTNILSLMVFYIKNKLQQRRQVEILIILCLSVALEYYYGR